MVGVQPQSAVILKQPIGGLPAGAKVLRVCGACSFHSAVGVFAGELKCSGKLLVIPMEEVLSGADNPHMEGLDLNSPAPSENAYMKRYSVANYAYRLRVGQER